MRVWVQSSHRSTWPPSADVRHVSMAVMTRRWPRPICPALAARHASPWRRKISATSRLGCTCRGGSGRRGDIHVQAFERALDLADRVDGDTRIAGRGGDLAVPKQVLN